MKKNSFDKALDTGRLKLQALDSLRESVSPDRRNEMDAHLRDLQKALDDLGAEKHRFHLFENKHTVMLLIDPLTAAIVDANPAAEKFYGYSKPELLAMKISDINTLSESDVILEMKRARNEERNFFNFQHRLANGEIHEVEVYSDPVNIDGRDFLFSIVHDVTRKKQTELALDRERRLLRTLIDNIPDQIFARDLNCRFILNNLADARVMGVEDPASLLGMTDFDFYPQKLAEKYQADNRRVMEADEPLIIPEEPCKTADGREFWASTVKIPLHDNAGNVTGLVGIAHDITERLQMEQSLRESEERFRSLFEEAIEGIVQSAPDGKILSANQSFIHMLGYDSIEEMGKAITQPSSIYANPEDRPKLFHMLSISNRIEGYEAEYLRKDGSRIWCSSNITAVRGKSKELLRLDTRLMDITERKLAELALHEKTEELDRFFNLSLDLLCIADTGGFFRRLNKAWEDTLGFTIGELIGNSFVDLVHPDDVQSTLTAISELSNQKPVINFVNRYRCKDGTYKWIEWRSVPVGNLIYAAARDISDHKISEERLFEAQRMLQLVLDTIPQRVFWKDTELKFLGCNQRLAADAGLTSTADIIGKTDFDLNWKDNAEQYSRDDQWVIDHNSPRLDIEEPQLRPDGSRSWLRTNKVPLHDRDGNVIGVLGTYEDVTKRRLAEEQVRLTNEKLTAMVAALEKRNREANLLREMDDLLQVCNSSEEAYTVTRQYGSRLFPSTSGALYLFDNSRRLVEAAAVWGDNLQSDLVFAPEDCWTLRRVQVHQSDSSTGLRCKHVAGSFSGQYIGFPMLAAGELMGMLHVENQGERWETKEVEDLARILAEHLALSLSNISLREKLHSQSIRDPLTGLFNRRYMEETLEREIMRASRAQSKIGVIMLDIDHFKSFNDNFGHEAGDAILQKMGQLLMGQVRGSDIACRFGGEEFILILPEASLDTARERAEQIRLAVKGLKVENIGQPLGAISVSLGVAVYPEQGRIPVDLLQKVDKALYLAKHNGRDRVEVAG